MSQAYLQTPRARRSESLPPRAAHRGGPPGWLFPLRRPGGSPSIRLIAFPYAAAGASALRPLVARLPRSIELLGAALPGRERRFSEPPQTSHTQIVQAVAAELAAREPLPTYLFGHSMGASLATAVALAEPALCQGVIVSACKPRRLASLASSALTDDEIATFLSDAGKTAQQLLENDFWRNRLVSLFRSDTELHEQTLRATMDGVLTQHVIALGGADDPYIDARDLGSWSARTKGPCDVMIFQGRHFFLLEDNNLPIIASALSDAIFKAVNGGPA